MAGGIPGTGSAIAVSNDAGAWFDIAMRAWGWFEQARAKLRARREAGEQLTPEEQALVDMNDDQAFERLRSDSRKLMSHADVVIDKHSDGPPQD